MGDPADSTSGVFSAYASLTSRIRAGIECEIINNNLPVVGAAVNLRYRIAPPFNNSNHCTYGRYKLPYMYNTSITSFFLRAQSSITLVLVLLDSLPTAVDGGCFGGYGGC